MSRPDFSARATRWLSAVTTPIATGKKKKSRVDFSWSTFQQMPLGGSQWSPGPLQQVKMEQVTWISLVLTSQ